MNERENILVGEFVNIVMNCLPLVHTLTELVIWAEH